MASSLGLQPRPILWTVGHAAWRRARAVCAYGTRCTPRYRRLFSKKGLKPYLCLPYLVLVRPTARGPSLPSTEAQLDKALLECANWRSEWDHASNRVYYTRLSDGHMQWVHPPKSELLLSIEARRKEHEKELSARMAMADDDVGGRTSSFSSPLY